MGFSRVRGEGEKIRVVYGAWRLTKEWEFRELELSEFCPIYPTVLFDQI